MRRYPLFAFLVVSLLDAVQSGLGAESLPDGFYRYPTIGGGAIVFAAEGDLWKVPVHGGVALRLTAYEGEETFPKLSPDGKLIAFTAQYEGNDDVYVVTATGGEPKRLTYHPAPDQAWAGPPTARVLFRSRRDTPHNDFRIYKISPEGGLPEMIPLEPAAWIASSPTANASRFRKSASNSITGNATRAAKRRRSTSARSHPSRLPKSAITTARMPSRCGRPMDASTL